MYFVSALHNAITDAFYYISKYELAYVSFMSSSISNLNEGLCQECYSVDLLRPLLKVLLSINTCKDPHAYVQNCIAILSVDFYCDTARI